jgi:hypothetical protein
MADFDFEAYAAVERLKYKEGPGNEKILDCVACRREEHLYYNTAKNVWNCHRCGEQGNYVSFVMLHQNCTYEEAVRLIEMGVDISITRMQSKLHEFIYNRPINIESKHKVVIPTPTNATRVTLRKYPMFFVSRNYPPDLVLSLNTMVCEEYPYENRIIFPFTCDGHTSFVAYAANKYVDPKTKNPPGSNNGELLYGYDMQPTANTLVVVEGITDAIRLWSWGYNAVALLGKNISLSHTNLLNRHRAREIVICFDGDVPVRTNKKNKGILDLAKPLIDCLTKHVSFIYINDDEKDPDNMSFDDFNGFYSVRVSYTALKIAARQNRFSVSKSHTV